MSDVAIHFAFASGVLRYDCPSCDQRCCKTGGLALFPAERERILTRYPALELVAPQEASDIGVFATPCSGCWFLEGQRCRLVADHGGALRPLACGLYPWNLLGSYHGTLVVAPHPLCPLIVDPGHGASHAEVLSLLRALGAAGAPPEPLRPQDPPAALALERLLREASAAALNDATPLLDVLAFQELVTRAFIAHGAAGLADADLDSLPAMRDELSVRMNALAAVAGLGAPSESRLASLAPLITAWLPSLRLFALPQVPLVELSVALVALTLYAAEWQSGRPERRLLPQTLTQLIGSLGPTLALLAAWYTPWRGRPVADLAPGDIPAEAVRLSANPLTRAGELRALGLARMEPSP